MCNIKCMSHVFVVCLIIFASTQVQAVAISTANALFYWDSLTINGDAVDNQEFLVDTEVFINNDFGMSSKYTEGDYTNFDASSSFNVSASAGIESDESYGSTTISESIFSDIDAVSAEAITTVYLPFDADGTEEASVSFLYDLFASADALLAGEFALAISSISFSLLGDDFSEIEKGLESDLNAIAIGGVDFPNAVEGEFNYTFFNLVEGNSYFLAIDTYAFSSTEAVPEPAILLLFFLGLALMARRNISSLPKLFSSRFAI